MNLEILKTTLYQFVNTKLKLIEDPMLTSSRNPFMKYLCVTSTILIYDLRLSFLRNTFYDTSLKWTEKMAVLLDPILHNYCEIIQRSIIVDDKTYE